MQIQFQNISGMLSISAEIMGASMMTSFTEHNFDMCLTAWTGRQTDVQGIDDLIQFLTLSKEIFKKMHFTSVTDSTDEAQPEPLSESVTPQVVPMENKNILTPDALRHLEAYRAGRAEYEGLLAEQASVEKVDHVRSRFENSAMLLAICLDATVDHLTDYTPNLIPTDAGRAAATCAHNAPDCPNEGWPLPCSKCGFCQQNPDELMSPERAAVEEIISQEWTEAATEIDLASQPSDSRDLEDFFDEDDDDDEWWDDDDDEWWDDDDDDYEYFGPDDDFEEEDAWGVPTELIPPADYSPDSPTDDNNEPPF